MTHPASRCLSFALFFAACVVAQERVASAPVVRFTAVDIRFDTGVVPLAAYQVELEGQQGVLIVGVENGEHAAFSTPPYYDPKALQDNRIILAAFSTAKDLPSGGTRVARLMLRVEGDASPRFTVKDSLAASSDGKPVPAKVSVEEVR